MHEYFSFLSEEGCQYLKTYLDMRMRQGEVLSPEAVVITPKAGGKAFISTAKIGEAMRKASNPNRPYVLRSYFATQMMMVEAKGLIIRDYRTFFMGHKGDYPITPHRTMNKTQLLSASSWPSSSRTRRPLELENTHDNTCSIAWVRPGFWESKETGVPSQPAREILSLTPPVRWLRRAC